MCANTTAVFATDFNTGTVRRVGASVVAGVVRIISFLTHARVVIVWALKNARPSISGIKRNAHACVGDAASRAEVHGKFAINTRVAAFARQC